jgi:effector-binding domain-containing protein
MTPYTVHLQRLDSIPLAVVKRQASPSQLSRLIPECCGVVWKVIKAQHAKGGRHVAIYWDDAVRLEVGAEVEGAFTETDGVVRSATPAGAVAWTTHLGPYGGLRAAHEAIHKWCAANEHKLAGPRWEIYGHWLPEWDADPSQIRTDVYYSLL